MTERLSPFIHKFQTDQNYYIYDINSNEIIKVNEIIYDIMDYYGQFYTEDIIQKLNGKYNRDVILEHIQSIEEARIDGLFCELRPQLVQHDVDTIRDHIEKKLNLLTLEVTEACNLRCKYCLYTDKYYYTRGYSSEFMDFKTAKIAIEYYIAHSSESKYSEISIGFYGGEPLLNFELIESCVRYVNSVKDKYDRNVIFNITTNGTLLNQRVSEFLVTHNFNMLVSLDLGREFHDKNRVFPDGSGSYEIITNNLKSLREKYPDYYRKVKFSSIVAPPYSYLKMQEALTSSDVICNNYMLMSIPTTTGTSYYEDFSDEDLIDADGNRELVQRYIDAFSNLSEDARSKISLTQLSLPTYLARHSQIVDIYKRNTHHLSKHFNGRLLPGGVCIPGAMRLLVSPDGKMYACDRGAIGNELLCIGDIYSGIQLDRVIKILNEAFNIYQYECTECWVCRLCGICYTHFEAGDKFSLEEKNKVCKSYRDAMNDSFVRFCQIMEKNPEAYASWDEDKFPTI